MMTKFMLMMCICLALPVYGLDNAKPTEADLTAVKLELEAIHESDQKHRKSISKATDEKERAKLWEQQSAIDKANQARLDEIVKIHGWPGQKKFGVKAAQSAFLVIQHSNLEMMKRYYPMLKAAADADDARKESFALLEDRIRMNEGRPQLYGSQLQRDEKTGKLDFWVIEDEVNVDKRRATMGMPPLAKYAKFFNVDYVPVADRAASATKMIEPTR